MHEYDFRCDACNQRFTLRFKSYALYDAATPLCPACKSADLTRVISQVAVAKTSRNYRDMSSQQMLSVLESGERGPVDELFRQVGGSRDPGAAPISGSVKPADLA